MKKPELSKLVKRTKTEPHKLDEILLHYGVKGMKWDKSKRDPQTTALAEQIMKKANEKDKVELPSIDELKKAAKQLKKNLKRDVKSLDKDLGVSKGIKDAKKEVKKAAKTAKKDARQLGIDLGIIKKPTLKSETERIAKKASKKTEKAVKKTSKSIKKTIKKIKKKLS